MLTSLMLYQITCFHNKHSLECILLVFRWLSNGCFVSHGGFEATATVSSICVPSCTFAIKTFHWNQPYQTLHPVYQFSYEIFPFVEGTSQSPGALFCWVIRNLQGLEWVCSLNKSGCPWPTCEISLLCRVLSPVPTNANNILISSTFVEKSGYSKPPRSCLF